MTARVMAEQKWCSHCGEVQPLKNFSKDNTTRDGLRYWCRECMSVYKHDAYHNPDHPAHASVILVDEKMRQPEHSYAWVYRERDWRNQGIRCVIGCEENRGYLCRTHYQRAWDIQDGRCALCNGLFFRGVKPYPAADHLHQDGKVGPFRGILHGGIRGSCNVGLLGRYENCRLPISADLADPLEAAIEKYLSDPPAALLADQEGRPRYATYRKDVKYSAPPVKE